MPHWRTCEELLQLVASSRLNAFLMYGCSNLNLHSTLSSFCPVCRSSQLSVPSQCMCVWMHRWMEVRTDDDVTCRMCHIYMKECFSMLWTAVMHVHPHTKTGTVPSLLRSSAKASKLASLTFSFLAVFSFFPLIDLWFSPLIFSIIPYVSPASFLHSLVPSSTCLPSPLCF